MLCYFDTIAVSAHLLHFVTVCQCLVGLCMKRWIHPRVSTPVLHGSNFPVIYNSTVIGMRCDGILPCWVTLACVSSYVWSAVTTACFRTKTSVITANSCCHCPGMCYASSNTFTWKNGSTLMGHHACHLQH